MLSTTILFDIVGAKQTIFLEYIDLEDTKEFLFKCFFNVFIEEKEGSKNKQILLKVNVLH